MDVDVTVRNYRCFGDTPARFSLRKGIQAFVGVNNSGKSSLLRLFYELRQVFVSLSSEQGVQQSLMNQHQGFSAMPSIKDQKEIFCNRHQHDLVLGFEMGAAMMGNVPTPSRFEVIIPYGTNRWSAKIYADGEPVSTNNWMGQPGSGGLVMAQPGTNRPVVGIRPVVELGDILKNVLYLGPFRNAVNIGGSGDYYDTQIGQPFISSWRSLKTGYQKEQSEATYRLTDDIRRIFGFASFDINASDDGRTCS